MKQPTNQDAEHPTLFCVPTNWQEEWQGMPEFIQNKKSEFAKIIVRFETQEDLENFSLLIGQKLTNKTKSIWHPFKSHWGNGERFIWKG